MRGFRSDTRAALGALLIAACLAAPARAQVGPPIRLVPTAPGAPSDTITPVSPDAGAPDQPSPTGVQATPLAPVDPVWTGSLAASEGALPETLWQGTQKAFVMAALPQLQPTLS